MNDQYIYWIGIAHLPRWTQEKINNLVIDILKNKQMSLQDFFELDNEDIKIVFKLNDKEISDINDLRKNFVNFAFEVEKLINQGINIIPINSSLYPKIMKENLKVKYAPTVIYTKGDTNILQETSVAIVGSRDASDDALNFTNNIAKKMAKEYKVVVSGFARGVDRQSLDSTIKYNGNSIIVLPQGISTFKNGLKKYKHEIENDGVLVLSTFPHNAGWSTGLAMARNRYIYGLAQEIYIAQTNSKGGTWTGANDGLKKNRKVFIYYPSHDRKSPAYELIQKGATPVDFDGNLIDIPIISQSTQLNMFDI